jgi:hypothetical protein
MLLRLLLNMFLTNYPLPNGRKQVVVTPITFHCSSLFLQDPFTLLFTVGLSSTVLQANRWEIPATSVRNPCLPGTEQVLISAITSCL